LTLAGLPSTLTSTSTTVTAASTTIDIAVTANTRYIEPGQPNPSISGVADGDTVQVTGAPAGTGTVTALSVDVPLSRYSGVVGPATSGFTLSLAPRWSDLTGTSTTIDVGLTSTTHYLEPGQSSPGPSGVVNGDTVYVTGVQAGTDAVTASVVVVPLAEATGTVSLLSTSGFTLTTAKGGTVAVDLSTSTKVKQWGVSSPVVQNGDTVEVIGTQAGQATVGALIVTIGAGRHGHHFGPGPVGPPHPGGGNGGHGHQGRG
jgi:endonuclease YncB( thermonuclease family)